jgi:thiol-disulfide isomerase/thioredoxin
MNRFARLGWLSFGLIALVAAGTGVWFSTRPALEREPAPGPEPAGAKALVFRVHAAPRPIAEIDFEDSAARKHTLAEFRGKVVLLNVWATWCAPCREEMPALDRLQQKLGGPRFEVLALSVDAGGAAAVKRFYEEIGVRSLAIYVDPAMRATGSLGLLGIPTTLLVDRDGREIGRRAGPAEWDGPDAARLIAHYLEIKAKP